MILKILKYKTYGDAVEFLLTEHGPVRTNYGREDTYAKAHGYFKHHIHENMIANLCDKKKQKLYPEEQKKENLVYCTFLEHLYLHILIGKTNSVNALGLGGAMSIRNSIASYLSTGAMSYSKEYYNGIDQITFSALSDMLTVELKNWANSINDYFEWNQTLEVQMEAALNEHDKALVILGTGLGKTTIVMQYAYRKQMKILVLAPKDIIKESWYAKEGFADVMTYEEFSRKCDTGIIDYTQYCAVVLDEAHHAGYDETKEKGAKQWIKGLNYLLENHIKTIALTATPIRGDGIDIQQYFKDAICIGYAIEDAIDNDIVYPFSYYTVIYDTTEFDEIAEECENQELIGRLNLAKQNLPTLKEAFSVMSNKLRKIIVFADSFDSFAEVKRVLDGTIPNSIIKEVHSRSNEIADDNYKWFEDNTRDADKTKILIAQNMISEGVHFSKIDTIIMFRKTSSYSTYVQMIGRIITLIKGNENPNAIVFDLVNNLDSITYKVESEDWPHTPRNIIEAIERKAATSNAVIVKHTERDFIDIIRDMKAEQNDSWEDWEIEILKTYYPVEGANGCQRRIDEEWERRHPGSLTA